MPENKPSVIPSQEEIVKANEEILNRPEMNMIDAANATGTEIANQFEKEQQIQFNSEVPMGEQAAAEAMRLKTDQQIAERERLLQQQKDRAALLDQERLKYMNQKPPSQLPPTPPTPPVTPPPSSPSGHDMPENAPEPVDKYFTISQPQMNASWDVIPLPSEGKLYRGGKKTLKVAYLTAADENVLTNPNVMESGEFLEILLNRKILDPSIRYKDLHIGDRNAIMIWLRATGYGHEYPITVYDPETAEPFEHIVDLSELKTITLNVDTDREGLIDFELPLTKKMVKIKLLTVGDIDEIEAHVADVLENDDGNVDTVTYTLERQIVEIDGNRDSGFIRDYIQSMRVGDSNAINKYISQIDSGIDMKLEIETPGGGSLNTFLPINFNFFWPNA
jgi:hypothetical protein